MIDLDGHNLVYLLGIPRSGTTLLSVMLDRHSQVLCPPEPWVMLALESFGKVSERHPAGSGLLGHAVYEFCNEAGKTAANVFAQSVYNQRLAAAGKQVFVDKTPRYFHILPFLKRTFPIAKWIWLKRDPFDVAASYKSSWNVNLAELLGKDDDYPLWSFDLLIGLDRLLRDVNPRDPQVLTLQYESLVRNPAHELERVMTFLGLEPELNQTRFELAGSTFSRSYNGDKKIVQTSAPHTRSISSWRHAFTLSELQILLDFIGVETMRQLGYAETLRDLTAMGIADPGPHRTAELRARVDTLYAERWADVTAAARDGAGQPWLAKAKATIAEQANSIEALASRANTAEQQVRQLTDERNLLQQEVVDQTALLNRVRTQRSLPRRIYRAASQFIQKLVIGFPHDRRGSKFPLPTITVVTPVYNSIKYIRDAIESVLSQNYPGIQYIIVDGGSTDGTMDIVNEYRDRAAMIFSEKDEGMYDALAKGFQYATGDILCYLNADDLFEAGGLHRVGEYFRDHPRAQVLYHEDTVEIDGWLFANAAQPPRMDRQQILKGHVLFQDGVFFRRSAYIKAGGINRGMRRAGDWDLWVRLGGVARFVRGHGHQSRFRVVRGQISENATAYWAELADVRRAWRKKVGPRGGLFESLWHYVHWLENLLWRRLKKRRLFFPLQSSGCTTSLRPTPSRLSRNHSGAPCPLTGKFPDRLLFTSRDTRFGDDQIHRVWHNSESHIAIVTPKMDRDELNVLYERHYSSPDAKIIVPSADGVSPFRHFRGGGPVLKWMANTHLPLVMSRGARWEDVTCEQLIDNLQELSRVDGAVDFLDVGCFEGRLLNEVRQRTDWRTFGLEANAKAAKIARDAGHEVWQAYAEDAMFIVPKGRTFDVIHLGQTIEHLNDPLKAIRRLRTLLKLGGKIVLSTPNLDSKQIDIFGPTWSHWHPPYHRYIFSSKSLRLLGRLANLKVERMRSYSHPYWTAMSAQLNQLGVGGAVPHNAQLGHDVINQALAINFWSRMLWDWQNKGDYLVAVFRKI